MLVEMLFFIREQKSVMMGIQMTLMDVLLCALVHVQISINGVEQVAVEMECINQNTEKNVTMAMSLMGMDVLNSVKLRTCMCAQMHLNNFQNVFFIVEMEFMKQWNNVMTEIKMILMGVVINAL